MTLGLHRNVSLLALTFTVVHVLTTVLDSFVSIPLPDAFIPFISSYRPIWVGLGAIAFDLMIALIATSLLRARMGLRSWRLVHWSAYLCWPVAVVHGLGTGTDTPVRWVLVLTVCCVLVVAALTLWRLARAGLPVPPPAPRALSCSCWPSSRAVHGCGPGRWRRAGATGLAPMPRSQPSRRRSAAAAGDSGQRGSHRAERAARRPSADHAGRTACQAHGVCIELLPELISADPWGYPIVQPGPVPSRLLALARRAVADCPTLALLLTEPRDAGRA